jgi:ATP-binding cassette subfamily C (CFTR/MRP) protein 1
MQLAKYMGKAQKTWVRGVQTRVDVTASMLRSMKVGVNDIIPCYLIWRLISLQEVKMLGLSDILTEMVQDLRVRELKLSKQYRKLLCFRVLLGRIP